MYEMFNFFVKREKPLAAGKTLTDIMLSPSVMLTS